MQDPFHLGFATRGSEIVKVAFRGGGERERSRAQKPLFISSMGARIIFGKNPRERASRMRLDVLCWLVGVGMPQGIELWILTP